MLTRWNELDRTFSWMNDFHRRMNELFNVVEPRRSRALRGTLSNWPAVNLYDSGDEFVIKALVPANGPAEKMSGLAGDNGSTVATPCSTSVLAIR